MNAPLEAVGLTKAFGATQALRDVDLTVRRGELVSLLGENGAGKSTLVRCVSGEMQQDSGTVRLDGQPLSPATPRRSHELGVSVIHQELSYFPDLSVAENLWLGNRESGSAWRANHRRMRARAAAALADLAPEIDVRARMASLRVADRQLIEIARAAGSGTKLLLMDEPTAALNAEEVDRLFAVIAELKRRGVGLIYISHRLDEVERLADRIVVMRDGAIVGRHDAGSGVSRDTLVAEIVGRELQAFLREHDDVAHGGDGRPARLRLDAVGSPLGLHDVTAEAARGEVLGFYGLAGSGVEHLGKAIVGAVPATGSVQVDGATHTARSPARSRKAGLVLVPADRRDEGIFPTLSVGANINMGLLANCGFRARSSPARDRSVGAEWAERVDLRPRDPAAKVADLSGGNQQKSIFARWLAVEPRVLVLDEPTKGVDVGAKAQMYDLIQRAADSGATVVVISPEVPELLAICHRVGVIRRGRLAAMFNRADVDEQLLVGVAIRGTG